MIISGKKPKFIIFFGFNETDEIFYNYLETKKKVIEKHIKEEAYIYCVKLIKQNNQNNNIEKTKREENKINNNNTF